MPFFSLQKAQGAALFRGGSKVFLLPKFKKKLLPGELPTSSLSKRFFILMQKRVYAFLPHPLPDRIFTS